MRPSELQLADEQIISTNNTRDSKRDSELKKKASGANEVNSQTSAFILNPVKAVR